MKNFSLLGIFLVFVFLPIFVFGETYKNVGFTSNEILVSNLAPILGENVRVSMPIYNETKDTLNGVVNLYINEEKKLEKPISVKSGQYSGVSYEWKAEYGKYEFVFKLEDTSLVPTKGASSIAILENREAKATIQTQGSKNIINIETDILRDYEDVKLTTDTDVSSSSIDKYRTELVENTKNKISFLKQDINESIKQNLEYERRLDDLKKSVPKNNATLLTPVQYFYVWFLNAVAFVASNKYFFYVFLGLLFFIIFRVILRRFTRHNRS